MIEWFQKTKHSDWSNKKELEEEWIEEFSIEFSVLSVANLDSLNSLNSFSSFISWRNLDIAMEAASKKRFEFLSIDWM